MEVIPTLAGSIGPRTVSTFLAARCLGTGCDGEVNYINPVVGRSGLIGVERIVCEHFDRKKSNPVIKAGAQDYASRHVAFGSQPSILLAFSTEIAVALPGIGVRISASG